MKILVTGAAGFIGFHLVKRLFLSGYDVVGIDNINDYYDVGLKYGRLAELGIDKEKIEKNTAVQSNKSSAFTFIAGQLEDADFINDLFEKHNFEVVCNLAAQAGVRFSLQQPLKFIRSNVVGFTNILEACKNYGVKHLVYASSSSVYGLNSTIPFKASQHTDHPVSLYAATKKSNELMAHVYSHIYQLPTTGLRFFTVYGPWGRPDMAYFSFTQAILKGRPIQIFNGGKMERDFTYVDDIVEGVYKILQKPSQPSKNFDSFNPSPALSNAPYRIYNIGNSRPVNLMDFIAVLEQELGVKALKEFKEMQPGDVPVTYADVEDLALDFNYQPTTSIQTGVRNFVKWYKEYYR